MTPFGLKAIKSPLACLLLFILMTGCQRGRNGRLPASTGQPYEVVVEGDTDSIVTKMLTADIPGLPQSEPLCNLIQVKKGKTRGSFLLVRNRVEVDISPHNKALEVKMSRDENATPQTVVRIKAASVEQLRTKLDGEKLRALIDQHELRHLSTLVKRNPEKQQLVQKLFGLDMKIPASMDASKKAKNFLWLSNNSSFGMQSLLFMRVKNERRGKGKNESFADMEAQVDSILRKNMLGETDDMYMEVPNLAERGLWEMKGDAMGGPYVMKVFPATRGEATQEGDGRIVVIGFVYAPEMKKRNLLKQLEAVLTTIK